MLRFSLVCCTAATASGFAIAAPTAVTAPLAGFHAASPRIVAARPLLRRCATPLLGLEVDDVDAKAVEELGVMNWPGLEKRAEDFCKVASGDELVMVYVKQGSAVVTDPSTDESKEVRTGQMVMISDGEARWTSISDGGLTLLSAVTALESLEEDESSKELGLLGLPTEGDSDEDLSLPELAGLLAAGLLAGGLLSFGLKTFNTPDGM